MPEPTTTPTGQQILDTPMEANDALAETVKGYLVALLASLWREGEGFSGKRPFGNSGWDGELYAALVKAGYITGSFDEDGYLESADDADGDRLISLAIKTLAGPAATNA
jgi:hypothetical protein